jgi:hypothetical protein
MKKTKGRMKILVHMSEACCKASHKILISFLSQQTRGIIICIVHQNDTFKT